MARNDNWTTPDALFEWLNRRFHFNVDAAASKKNTKCRWFYSKENSFLDIPIDRLAKQLKKRKAKIFCNPPYSRAQEFVERLYILFKRYGIQSYCLLPQRCDRIWFQRLLHSRGVRDEPFTGRIHFGNSKSGAFMYNLGAILGFKSVRSYKYVDAGQFNKGKRGSAES